MPLVETTEHNDESLLLDVADATLFGSSQRNLRLQQQQQPFLESLNASSSRCNPPPTSLLSFPSKASSKTVMTDVSGITSDFQDVDLVEDGQHQEQQDTDIPESSVALQDQQEQAYTADQQGQQLSNSLPHQRRKLMSSTALDKIDDQSKHSYTTSHLFQEMSEQAQIAHLQLKVKKLQGELENSKDENKTLLENFEHLQSLCNDLLLENARLKGLETLSEDPANEAGNAMPPLKMPGDDDAILPVEEHTLGCTAKTPKKKNISRQNSTGSLQSELPPEQQKQQQQENDLGLSSSSHHFFIDTEHSIHDEDNDELFYEVNPEGSDTDSTNNDKKQITAKHHHTMRRTSFIATPQHQLEDLDIDVNGSQNGGDEDDGTEGGGDDLHIGFVHNRKPSFVKRSNTAPSRQTSIDDTTSVQSLPSAAAAAPSRWRLNPFASDATTGTTADKADNDDISSCRSVEPTRTQSTPLLAGSQKRFNDKNGYNEKLDESWMSLVGTKDDTNIFTTSKFKSRRRRGSGEGADNCDDAMSICSSPARPEVIGGGTNSERRMWKASSLRTKSSSSPTAEPETSSSEAPETSTKKIRRWSLPKMLSMRSTTSTQEDGNGDGDNTTKNDEAKGESENYSIKNATANGTDHIDETGITSTSNTSSMTGEEDKSSLYASVENDDDESSTESDMPFDRTAMPGIANHMSLSSTDGRVTFSSMALDEKSGHSCQDDLDDDEISVHTIEQKKMDQRIQQAQYYQEHSQGYL